MKKKYVILIVVGLFLVIGGYFGYKGFNLYVNVYSIEKSSDMKEYFKGLKIEDTITVKINNQSDYEKLSIKGLSIKNENNNFILSSELTNTEDVKGFELKDDNSTKILMSKTLFDFYEAIGKDEKWIHKIMEEKNINNYLDLLLYAIKNKDNKPTIFSSIKEMKFYNYVYYLYIQTCSLKLEGIKLIDGDLKGYIVETKDMPIREINLIDGSNKYIISLWNKEYFTYEYIKELLSTVDIDDSNNEEFTKITINSKEMDIKVDDYNKLSRIFNSLNYNLINCDTTPMYTVIIENRTFEFDRHFKKVKYDNKCANIEGEYLTKSIEILNFIYSNNEMNNIENVKMEIKDGTLTKTGMTIIITDTNKEHYQYGVGFRIDVKENGIWKKAKQIGEAFFTTQALSVNKDNQLELHQGWEHIYGELEKGEYRLVKSVCANDGCYESKYFSVEFTIE